MAVVEAPRCASCGETMAAGASLCRACGWDAATAALQRPRPRIGAVLAAGGWRLAGLALVIAIAVGATLRLESFGPGPDLPTTVRWIAIGDDGRAAELVTLHRAFETASAAARYALREVESPPFGDGWDEVLAPYATPEIRGWIPLLFYGADTEFAPEGVREFYRVRAVDGWGRPYRVATRLLERDKAWPADPEVSADLAAVLEANLFRVGSPDFEQTDTLRLEMASAGPDGDFDTGDDLRMISYVPIGMTLHLSSPTGDLQRAVDRAYLIGRHWFRFEGNRWDLIDARLLAEFRLEMLS